MDIFQKISRAIKLSNILKNAEFEFDEHCASDENYAMTVADNYFQLLKHVHKKGKTSTVSLDADDCFALTIDGEICDLDVCIRHSDTKYTELKMEIEALLADGVSAKEVQRLLENKIRNEW